VANPGCYPTAALVALGPLAAAGLLADAIVDAKSGLSGAGATPSPATHFAKASESVTPYKLYSHRHAPEIAARLDALSGGHVPLTFTPHLVPMERGILSTAYATFHESIGPEALAAVYEKAYGKEPFVRLLPDGALPDTKHTSRTNFVDLAFAVAPDGRRATVVTALDNLVKGAAGQAVQNLNILLGQPETAGLLDVKTESTAKVIA
jgi:N-acetyl-gamma-glutamyl-phosphate reductase